MFQINYKKPFLRVPYKMQHLKVPSIIGLTCGVLWSLISIWMSGDQRWLHARKSTIKYGGGSWKFTGLDLLRLFWWFLSPGNAFTQYWLLSQWSIWNQCFADQNSLTKIIFRICIKTDYTIQNYEFKTLFKDI